jgi:hypothetical protein
MEVEERGAEVCAGYIGAWLQARGRLQEWKRFGIFLLCNVDEAERFLNGEGVGALLSQFEEESACFVEIAGVFGGHGGLEFLVECGGSCGRSLREERDEGG